MTGVVALLNIPRSEGLAAEAIQLAGLATSLTLRHPV